MRLQLSSAFIFLSVTEALTPGRPVIFARQKDKKKPKETTVEPEPTGTSFFPPGWALSASTCPEGLGVVCKFQHACCPDGTVCDINSLGGAVACCPDTNSCSALIKTLPKCADDGHVLYKGPSYFFCCLPGQIGVLPAEGGLVNGLCAEADASVPKTLLATEVEPNSAGTPTGTSNSGNDDSSPAGNDDSSQTGTAGSDDVSAGSATRPDGTSESNSSSSGGGGGLSGGAIAGIVIGALLAIALIIAGVLLGIRYGRRQAANNGGADPSAAPLAQEPTGTPAPGYTPNVPPYNYAAGAYGAAQEKHGQPVMMPPAEQKGLQSPMSEMDGSNTRGGPNVHELQ